MSALHDVYFYVLKIKINFIITIFKKQSFFMYIDYSIPRRKNLFYKFVKLTVTTSASSVELDADVFRLTSNYMYNESVICFPSEKTGRYDFPLRIA